ncbi:retropepsin-like aspartic protease family protein [Novosphingobium cyanobacteriorum]|uniref:TIGR02281 family clan AA aspartic protease n=1 Tax=Novosphingobium cyanobacteriorum TaxID=3024215 RepID=A0ABT6CLY4_9SPHN|nr:TIGR02281 family clan AA aspartic protease [Novosphingobium cyanobacteriorum]MDF8334248.1 TIGR02281 family clan AA aspartic protease [Novosphingobium cyanobacteriorum]
MQARMDRFYQPLEAASPYLAHLPPLIVAALAAIVLTMIGGVVARRLPMTGNTLRFMGNVVLIVVFCLAALRFVRLDPTFDSLGSSIALPAQTVSGTETRVPLSADGHYWIEARLNGTKQRFMVDTGATLTTLSEDVADEAGIGADPLALPVVMRTANGQVQARMGRAEKLRFGSIEASDMDVVIAPSTGGLNVLGMNFLTRLKGWRVEDGVLVLTPKKPVAEASESPAT